MCGAADAARARAAIGRLTPAVQLEAFRKKKSDSEAARLQQRIEALEAALAAAREAHAADVARLQAEAEALARAREQAEAEAKTHAQALAETRAQLEAVEAEVCFACATRALTAGY